MRKRSGGEFPAGRETGQMERRLVTRPFEIGQIIGIGRNYRREDLRPEDYPAVPKIFLKSGRSVIRTGEAIVITPANGRAPDYDVIAEPELGVYLARGGRNIGIAVNPRRRDLIERLKAAGTALPVVPIEELRQMGESLGASEETGPFGNRVVLVVEHRDGTVLDVVRQKKSN